VVREEDSVNSVLELKYDVSNNFFFFLFIFNTNAKEDPTSNFVKFQEETLLKDKRNEPERFIAYFYLTLCNKKKKLVWIFEI